MIRETRRTVVDFVDKARKVKFLLKFSTYTYRQIEDIVGVDISTISKINKGTRYADVPQPELDDPDYQSLLENV